MDLTRLPDGVRRIVYSYLRSEVATIIADGIKNQSLQLRYVRMNQLIRDGKTLLDIFPIPFLKELRPSTLGSVYYGEGTIQRTLLSVGERVRLIRLRRRLSN